jgi:hypothetical protein
MGEMFGRRRRAEAGPVVADDPAHDDDPEAAWQLLQSGCRTAAPAEHGGATIPDRLSENLADVPGPRCFLPNLIDKAPWIVGAMLAAADARGRMRRSSERSVIDVSKPYRNERWRFYL